jgi:hypothetical protein
MNEMNKPIKIDKLFTAFGMEQAVFLGNEFGSEKFEIMTKIIGKTNIQIRGEVLCLSL